MTKERPILFSGAMVRALLEGRKSQTRRGVKGTPVYVTPFIGSDKNPTHEFGLHWTHEGYINKHVRCPYGQPGDRLWVRETWALEDCGADGQRVIWKADRAARWLGDGKETVDSETFYLPSDYEPDRWRPSIHMPRWASRLTLEVTEVRVQRLLEIAEEDIRAEGLSFIPSQDGSLQWWLAAGASYLGPRRAFEALWDSINGERPGCSWEANPWVWAISFKVLP